MLHTQCSHRIHPSVSCTGPHNACNAHWQVSSWPVLGCKRCPVSPSCDVLFWRYVLNPAKHNCQVSQQERST